jgi:hypothetical protein
MSDAGLVLDHAPDLAPLVVNATTDTEGVWTLERARKAADKKRRERKDDDDAMAGLPDDLRVLVREGLLVLDIAVRRSKLPDDYAQRVAAGELELDEAEYLAKREESEHKDALKRIVNALMNFLDGYDTARHLSASALRPEVLGELGEFDRNRITTIEKENQWASGQK